MAAPVRRPEHVDVAHGSRLDGKAVLVTGATGALGRAVAVGLAERGAAIALDHRGHAPDVVAEIDDELDRIGVQHVGVVADCSSSTDVAQMFAAAEAALGTIDIVVHTPGMVTKKPFVEITDEEFDESVVRNIKAAFLVLREAARRVADNGRIITLTTSITGVTIPGYGIYAGHKAATEHYVRALAKELGPRGITVNAVGPGPINSEFYFGVETAESFAAASRMSGAGRLGEWADVVPVIAFLATPDAHWVTAQTIRVNGGMTA